MEPLSLWIGNHSLPPLGLDRHPLDKRGSMLGGYWIPAYQGNDDHIGGSERLRCNWDNEKRVVMGRYVQGSENTKCIVIAFIFQHVNRLIRLNQCRQSVKVP